MLVGGACADSRLAGVNDCMHVDTMPLPPSPPQKKKKKREEKKIDK